MSTNDSGGFWSALFNVSKDDKIMIWLLRIILLVITISLFISLPIYFYDRAHNRESSQLFGLLTFHPDKQDSSIKSSEAPIDTSALNVKKEVIPKKTTNNKANTLDTKRDTTINGKNINTGINNGIIGDNGVQNFGIQPRVITEQSEVIQFFLSNYSDKLIRIQFLAPVQEGEIINVKNQIIKILSSNGYSNIENIPGIRLKIDPTLPIDRIVLLNNTLGGIIFYIPAALK